MKLRSVFWKPPGFVAPFVAAIIAVACWSSTAESAEKWSCEMQLEKGKTYKQEWIVSDDKMFKPNGKAVHRVVLNNSDTLLALLRFWVKGQKDRTYNEYFVIAKSTGVVIEFDDITADTNFGPQPEEWVPPHPTLGHCSLERP